jgi:hypothetical protein
MATKQIYIKDEDKVIFEEAEKIFEKDSLSAIIAKSLKQYLEMEKAKKEGFEEILIEIGRKGGKPGESNNLKEIKFIGKELAYYRDYSGAQASDDRGTNIVLYLTRKNKYLLHSENWSRWQGEYSHMSYEIFDNLEDIEETEDESERGYPASLIREAKEKLGQESADFLDI